MTRKSGLQADLGKILGRGGCMPLASESFSRRIHSLPWPGRVAHLVRASSQYANVSGSISGQGTY